MAALTQRSMPTLLDFRRRIRSVKSTQQITRAMKFVAAAKLRRAQEGVFAARPYAREILRVLRSAAARMETTAHPLLERRPEERILVVVLTGDRGLAGAFNANVLRRAMSFSRENTAKKIQVIAVGKKGRDTLRKRGCEVCGEYVNVSTAVEFSDRERNRRHRSRSCMRADEVDAVYAVYNEFKNVMVQKLTRRKAAADRSSRVEARTREERANMHGRREAPAKNRCRMKRHPSGESLVDYIYEQPVELRFSAALCRAIWNRKSFALCWNRRRRNTPRA